jgi:hypothetical protein
VFFALLIDMAFLKGVNEALNGDIFSETIAVKDFLRDRLSSGTPLKGDFDLCLYPLGECHGWYSAEITKNVTNTLPRGETIHVEWSYCSFRL